MVTIYYGVIDFSIGFQAGMKAFTAAVLGGIGSIRGAMLGGLIILATWNWNTSDRRRTPPSD
jgi:branched-chain amino acid transport system permease protein